VPIGIGSDAGGSLRFPAAFCGVYSFKPTQTRFSSKGMGVMSKIDFQLFNHFPAAFGAFGKSVPDLITQTKVLADPDIHEIDCLTTPAPWNEQLFADVKQNPSKIRIGILEESPHLPVSAAVKRAIAETEAACRRLGYETVKFKFAAEDWDLMRDIFMCVAANELNKGTLKELSDSGEKMMPNLKTFRMLLNSNFITRRFLDFAIGTLMNNPRGVKALRKCRIMPELEYATLVKKRYNLCHKMASQWKEAGITALISPTYPHCAFKSKNADVLSTLAEYTPFWNITGFPVGVMQVTKVKEDE